MRKKSEFLNKSILLAIWLMISIVTINSTAQINQAAREQYGLAEQMKDGAILHAWSWSFNTIKNNMKTIAEAGYTSVQTSPINKCVVGNGGDLKFDDQWWYHYQPTNYTIGNYQLGTKSEFEAMCNEADKYGVRIIVDAVVNHMTSDWGAIESPWNDRDRFHTNVSVGDWNNRWEVTQKALLGLWDLNTQSSTVANGIKDFLVECVTSGASGFRYDAAKHIELPGEYESDFWTIVLDNGAEFQYGEILQDGISKEDEYSQYMSVTASNYGKKLRDNINDKNLSTSLVGNWDINIAGDKMVTWVESHDTYANSPDDWGSSVWMNDWHVKMLWAVIGARKDGAPLFFSRPKNGGNGIRFPGASQIGDVGSDLFFDSEIAWVNHFRNQMVGETEFLRNYNGSGCLMIERGNKGVVIVNSGDAQQLNSPTQLANGTYKDQVSGGSFTVAGGNITGSLHGGKVHVIYNPSNSNNPTDPISNSEISATPASGSSFKTSTLQVTLKFTDVTNAKYTTSEGASGSFTNGQIITIGASTTVGNSITVTLTATSDENESLEEIYTYVKKDPASAVGTTVYFKKPNSWSTPNIYFYEGAKNNGWPGEAMSLEEGDIYSFVIPESYENPNIVFNSGSAQAPSVGEEGFTAVHNGLYDTSGFTGLYGYEDNEAIKTFYFTKPNDWGASVNAYVYDLSGSKKNAEWPGEAMESVGSDVYKYTIDCTGYTKAGVVFNDGTKQAPAPMTDGFVVIHNAWYSTSGLDNIVLPVGVSNFTADLESPQKVGTAIKLTATGENGTTPYQYKFTATINGVETEIATYQSSNSTTWTPTVNGSYTLKAYIKDANSNIVESELTYLIDVASGLNVTRSNTPIVYSNGRTVYIHGQIGNQVAIINIAGSVIEKFTLLDNISSKTIFLPGIYIVTVENKATKIVVK